MDKLQNMMPASSGGRKKTFRIVFSYAFDYAVIAVLAVLYAVLDKILTPFAQHFSITNTSLMYPIADPERIPIMMAMVYSCICPAVIIAIYTLAIDGTFSIAKKGLSRSQRYTWTDRLWELNCGVLGLFLAQGTAFVITGSLKNLIGKPRPDLLARCQVDVDKVAEILNSTDYGLRSLLWRDPGPFANSTGGFGLWSRGQICKADPSSYLLQDGFRSFPSGHSSSSFAGLFYLSLYLAAKLHVLDQRGETWRTFVVMVPTLAAAMIAGSRIIDARHHPFDVMFGSALGLLCGWGSYRQYFPPVSHTWEKGRAYPIRTWGVPLRHPDGTMGTDGQFYAHGGQRVDRTANAMMPEDEEDRQALFSGSNMNMEPMPSRTTPPFSSSANAPSFHQFQQRHPPERRGSPGSSEDADTDYEHVRMKAGAVTSMPVEGLARTQQQQSRPGTAGVGAGGNNAFRAQVDRNQSMRGEQDEQDVGFQKPTYETR